MAETTITQTSTDPKKGRWALLKEMFAEMDRLHAQMKQDQEAIDRSQVVIKANLIEIETILNRLSAS